MFLENGEKNSLELVHCCRRAMDYLRLKSSGVIVVHLLIHLVIKVCDLTTK